MFTFKKTALASLSMACAFSIQASAIDFSFTGNLGDDDDVQLFSFVVGAPSTVTLRTWSYAGGVNAAGAIIPQGGFDPILALFDSTGALLDQNDDGSGVPVDAVTGQAYDTLLTTSLGAGTYTVSVAQYANFAIGPNLSDGFAGSGTTGFEDVTGDIRTSAWAFDILNVESASIGVPDGGATALLLGLSFLGIGGIRRMVG